MNAKDFALAVPVIGALLACGYSDDRKSDLGGVGGDNVVPPPVDVATATIDVGAGIDVTSGEGVGAFVEYQGNGRWRIFVSCDTAVSNYACLWDIVVTPHQGSLDALKLEDAEPGDSLGSYGDNSARFIANTDLGFDGFTLNAEPGSTLRVDVYLDREPAPKYIYWVGDGALNRGSPTNPIDLTPSAP